MKCGTIPVARETWDHQRNFRWAEPFNRSQLSPTSWANISFTAIISLKFYLNFISKLIWCDAMDHPSRDVSLQKFKFVRKLLPFDATLLNVFPQKKRETFSVQTDWLWPLFDDCCFHQPQEIPPNWVTLRQLATHQTNKIRRKKENLPTRQRCSFRFIIRVVETSLSSVDTNQFA